VTQDRKKEYVNGLAFCRLSEVSETTRKRGYYQPCLCSVR